VWLVLQPTGDPKTLVVFLGSVLIAVDPRSEVISHVEGWQDQDNAGYPTVGLLFVLKLEKTFLEVGIYMTTKRTFSSM